MEKLYKVKQQTQLLNGAIHDSDFAEVLAENPEAALAKYCKPRSIEAAAPLYVPGHGTVAVVNYRIDHRGNRYSSILAQRLVANEQPADTDDDLDICPACGGDLRYLGGLGNLNWFRCRSCGLEHSQKTGGNHD